MQLRRLEPKFCCVGRRGWQQAVSSLAALAARAAAASGQLGAIAQGTASAISLRALGSIPSTISSQKAPGRDFVKSGPMAISSNAARGHRSRLLQFHGFCNFIASVGIHSAGRGFDDFLSKSSRALGSLAQAAASTISLRAREGQVQWSNGQTRLGPVAHFIASVGATAERSRVPAPQWPLYQGQPNGCFMKASGHLIKAPWPFYQGRWPFYQGRWPFYQGELWRLQGQVRV